MSHPSEYFAIPSEYGHWLGLRWSPNGREAIEHVAVKPSIGVTFAMNEEVSRFLTGLHSIRPPMEFAYILHLMKMIGVAGRAGTSPRARRHINRRLSLAFYTAGRPLRNAGALCGMLARDIPRLHNEYAVSDLNEFPRRPWLAAMQAVAWIESVPGPEPSLDPLEFESRIQSALGGLDSETLAHWMTHGRGPVTEAGEAVAEEVAANEMRSLPEALDDAANRPRLVAARPLVVKLEAALAIPPRRRSSSTLPIGGYADVTTRGGLEAILPSQLALDPLEFLRRFASRELLYYHREEPRSAEDEELILVVDQGIRTWGDPRLVLAAATIALAKRAAGKGVSLSIFTSGGGTFSHEVPPPGSTLPTPPAVDPEALGKLLEASDFTRSPAAALNRALLSEARQPARDIVLLSHPRSVQEPDVIDAARLRGPHTRLFSATVDESGEVSLSELREGGTVPISRCRVTIPPVVPPPAPTKITPTRTGGWTGDIERIPFPFPVGVVHPLASGQVVFDHAGDRLLAVAGALGMLHVWDVTTGATEILPRPVVDDRVVSNTWGVIGVRGGFVVASLDESGALIASHYNFVSRVCHAHNLGPPPGPRGPNQVLMLDMRYDPTLHAVAFRHGNHPHRASAVDLGVRKDRACFRAHSSSGQSSKVAHRAALRANSMRTPKPHIVIDDETVDPGIDTILFDPTSGRIRAQLGGTWAEFLPLRDGKPALKDRPIFEARYAGGTLALSDINDVHLFSIPSGTSLGSYPLTPGFIEFALSSDGRRIVRQIDRLRLEVHDVGSSVARLRTEKGRVHDRMGCFLGDRLLALGAGKLNHEILWRADSLVVIPFNDDVDYRPSTGNPEEVLGDSRRYLTMHHRNGLTAFVDVLGQVAILDEEQRLIAMFHAFRGRLSGWMPDGTMIGPRVPGGPPPPASSLRRFAEALRAAETRPLGSPP